jgi:hypothetical protein
MSGAKIRVQLIEERQPLQVIPVVVRKQNREVARRVRDSGAETDDAGTGVEDQGRVGLLVGELDARRVAAVSDRGRGRPWHRAAHAPEPYLHLRFSRVDDWLRQAARHAGDQLGARSRSTPEFDACPRGDDPWPRLTSRCTLNASTPGLVLVARAVADDNPLAAQS